ncbi:MAG: CPBP family intramembrane metalloprotease [Thermoplasmata archaeon]|nr:CPBP family intramembrane metalloprotease [Thermoplasmata archaeon]
MDKRTLHHDKQIRRILSEPIGLFKKLGWGISFLTYLAMLIFSCGLLIYLTPMVLEWMGRGGSSVILVSIVPAPIGFSAGGAFLQLWFMAVVVCVNLAVFSQIYGFFNRGDWGRRFGSPDRADGPLETTAKLLFASFFFVYGYYILLEMAGISPDIPDFYSMPIEELIYSIVNASVNEEIISRVFLIGIPLFFLIPRKYRGYSKKLFNIKRLKLLTGGGLTIDYISIILIIMSSIIFALAHVLGSWDMYKFLPTLVSGAFLGYLFVTRGLATSIIFHFSTNFIFFSTEFWPDSQIVVAVVGLMLIVWMITGAYFFVKFLLGLFGRTSKNRTL